MENNTETSDEVKKNILESNKKLDDILNSALADFEKISVKSKSSPMDKNATSAIDDLVQSTSSAQSTSSVQSTVARGDSTVTISEAVKQLSESTKDIGTDISDMLQQFDLGSGEDAALLPFIENALQTFLCKDMLYPSMTEIRDKYPEWLEEHKSTLSSTELNRYSKQHDLIKQICVEFDNEKDTDSHDVKSKRFKILLALMQKVNECGDPPKELVSDNFFSVDENGFPNMPSQMEDPQCPVS